MGKASGILFDKVATGHVDSCCEFLKQKWCMDKMNEIYLGEAFLGKKIFKSPVDL